MLAKGKGSFMLGASCSFCGLVVAACCVVPIFWGYGGEKIWRQWHRFQEIPIQKPVIVNRLGVL